MISLLSEAVTQYVAYRRSLGCGMVNDAQILQMFCRVMGLEALVNEIAPDRVLSFLDGTGPVTCYWHRKHQVLGGFYRFALARNYVLASPLPVECPPRPLSKAPYIYTWEELLHLLQSTDSFPNRKNTLARYCFRVLLLLLYGAGLRISEALALTVADTDLVAGVLTIRDTKFYKTRLVPIGPDLKSVLVELQQETESAGGPHGEPAGAIFLESARSRADQRAGGKGVPPPTCPCRTPPLGRVVASATHP